MEGQAPAQEPAEGEHKMTWRGRAFGQARRLGVVPRMQCEQPAKRPRVGAVLEASAVEGPTAKELLLQAASREAAAAALGQHLPVELEDDDVWRRDAGPEWQAWWQGERVAAPVPSSSPPHAAPAADVSTQRPPLPAAAAGASSGGAVPRSGGVPRAQLLHAPAFDAGARDFPVGERGRVEASTAIGLVSLLPADERPRVPVGRGSQLPRSARQAALDTFANRILAAAASASGVAGDEFVRSAVHTAARREALLRAVAVEGDVAAQSTSAVVYRNKAAQRLREPMTHAASSLDAQGVSSRTAAERDAMLAACVVLRSETCVAFFEAALAARAHAEHLLWEPPYWWRKKQELEALRTAAHDDDAVDDVVTRDAAEQLLREAPVEDAVVEPAGRAERQVENASDDAAYARVTDAVRSYVRQCVGELAEGVLSAAAASSVVERASAKVLGRHSQARDLAFLNREGARIRELCVQYVRKQAAAVVARLKDNCK
jgi:hypothetical protein